MRINSPLAILAMLTPAEYACGFGLLRAALTKERFSVFRERIKP